MLDIMTNSQQHLMAALDSNEVKYGWETLDHLASVCQYLGNTTLLGDERAQCYDLVQRIISLKQFYRNEYADHLCKSSHVAEHCRQHAMSNGKAAPEDSSSWPFACFPKCDHEHTASCESCSEHEVLYMEVRGIVLQVKSSSA